MSGSFRTHALAELAALPRGAAVRVAGRALEAAADGAVLLCDASATCRLRLVPGTALGTVRAGDLLSISGAMGGSAGEDVLLERAAVAIATRRRSVGGYPERGCELLRLAGGSRRRENLVLRDAALRALRRFFHERGFVEVEAPLVVPSPGLEVHLDALGTTAGTWLITSPEYQLKRLLVGGLEKVFAISRCYRRGERGAHHDPEFTMLEWYRAWDGYESLMDDVEALVPEVARAVGAGDTVRIGEREVSLAPPWERLTVREAFERYARGVEVLGNEPVEVLRERFDAAGLPAAPPGAPWDDLFFQAFLAAVEPNLGVGRPTILYEWPAPLCALARKKASDPRVVERFEVYAGGLELANAFGELCDPDEQRARFASDLQERSRRGLPLYPIDQRFLAALDEGMPPSAGIALGVDRLLMLCLGVADIREVAAFTSDEL